MAGRADHRHAIIAEDEVALAEIEHRAVAVAGKDIGGVHIGNVEADQRGAAAQRRDPRLDRAVVGMAFVHRMIGEGEEDVLVERLDDAVDEHLIVGEQAMRDGEALRQFIFERHRDHRAIRIDAEPLAPRGCRAVQLLLIIRPDIGERRVEHRAEFVAERRQVAELEDPGREDDRVAAVGERRRRPLHDEADGARKGVDHLRIGAAAQDIIGIDRGGERADVGMIGAVIAQRAIILAIQDVPADLRPVGKGHELFARQAGSLPFGRHHDMHFMLGCELAGDRPDDVVEPPESDIRQIEQDACHSSPQDRARRLSPELLSMW